jgi:hypothetical protein
MSQFFLKPVDISEIKSDASLQVGVYRDKWRYSMARLAFESEELNSEQTEAISLFLQQNFPLSSLHSAPISSSNSAETYRSMSQKMNLTELPFRSDFVSQHAERALVRQLLNEPRFLISSSTRSEFRKPADFLAKYDIYHLTMEYNLKLLRSFAFRGGKVEMEDIQIPRRFDDSLNCPAQFADDLINFPLSKFTLKEVEHIREFILIYAESILRQTSQQRKTNSSSLAESNAKRVREREKNFSSSELQTPLPLATKRPRYESSIITSTSQLISKPPVKDKPEKEAQNFSNLPTHSRSFLPPSSISSTTSLATLATASPAPIPAFPAIIPSPFTAGKEVSTIKPGIFSSSAPPSKSKYASRIPCPCCNQITHKTVCDAYSLGFNEKGEWNGEIKRLSKNEKQLHACYRVWKEKNSSSAGGAPNSAQIS